MYWYPLSYRALFLIALFPGLVAISLTFFLREKRFIANPSERRFSFGIFYRYWKIAPSAFKLLAYPLLFFSVFNSSDLFLLMKAGSLAVGETYVIGLFILYNVVYAIAAYPAGLLADKAGFKVMIVAGLCLFAVAYFLFAFSTGLPSLVAAFVIYGLYAACTEGISKAWLACMVPAHDAATALGTFTAGQSVAALLASTLTGLVWLTFGAPVALSLCALSALATAAVIFKVSKQPILL
jgi:MFS family permease